MTCDKRAINLHLFIYKYNKFICKINKFAFIFSFFFSNIYVLLCAKCNRTATTTKILANTLAVQWLGLHAFTAEGPSSVPGWGTKIIQAALCSQTRKTNNLDLSFKNLTSNAGFR